MNHRERVKMALNHEEPDRCPMQVSFVPELVEKIQHELGKHSIKAHNPHGGGNTYEIERALDQDMLLSSVGWANSYYQKNRAGEEYTDEWGVGWKVQGYTTSFGKGIYTEINTHPLAADDAIDNYTPPDPNRKEIYLDTEQVIRDFKDEYWIVGVTVTTIFETAWALRGLEQLMIDMLVNPELTDRILDIPYQYHLTAAKKLTEMGVDMIWTGDDIGGQHGMMLSPELWRTYLKPRMANFISTLKAINPHVKVAYHTDGNVYPVIEDFIEIGLDVLNPVQPASMDPEQLKADFGDRLCFWGSIDEQYTLPFGTPAEVEAEVIKRLQTIGKGGGLIIGPTHHVQLDTPIENFRAMINTIRNTPYRKLT